MFGKRKQKSDIMDDMSIFSMNNDPVVIPAETAEEPEQATDVYADVTEEDYTTAEEPDFGDDA